MADEKKPKKLTTAERLEALKALREGRAKLEDFPELRDECKRRGGLPNE